MDVLAEVPGSLGECDGYDNCPSALSNGECKRISKNVPVRMEMLERSRNGSPKRPGDKELDCQKSSQAHVVLNRRHQIPVFNLRLERDQHLGTRLHRPFETAITKGRGTT